MGPGILPETTVGKHNLPCHLQMPTKFISCKKEAICEHGSDVSSCPVGQGSFKMDFQSGNVFYGQTSPNLTFLLEITDGGVLRAKEEGGLPTCYQHSVQKPASLMVWGCISGYGICSLRVLEGTMNAERYIKVLEQHQLPAWWYFREGLVYFNRTIQNHILQLLKTAWLLSPCAELACLQSRSFTYREHLAHH